MKKTLVWLKDYWGIPFLILAGILAWIVFKKNTPLAQTRAELEAIEAGRLAREIQEREGLLAAKAHLARQYATELAALDAAQKAKAKEISDDPAKLAKFLVLAGRNR